MPHAMNAMIRRYNYLTSASLEEIDLDEQILIPCKVKGFMSGTYGKLP